MLAGILVSVAVIAAVVTSRTASVNKGAEPAHQATQAHHPVHGVESGAARVVKSAKSGAWSDPAVWGGVVPSSDSTVRVTKGHVVTVGGNLSPVAGVEVDAGASLVFDPDLTTTLESTRNVVIEGKLEMKPTSPAILHTLRFVGVDQAAFVGGGMAPIASDTGLWVTGAGRLDLVGSRKTGWTRAAGSITRGASVIALSPAPSGWRTGDEVAIAPTDPPGGGGFTTFDDATITTSSGSSIGLSRPTTRQHPKVGNRWTAEVANLTRNVRIEGTAAGPSHVFVRSSQPQIVNYVQIRYMGPRQPDPENAGYGKPVVGRYGLHFHMAGDGSRGSLVQGTVVRDTTNHAFVPHSSHGVTFRDTVAYNTMEDAYWWDQAPDPSTPGPTTHDTVIDHALAAKVTSDSVWGGYRLCGFNLARGLRNQVSDSVAVGIGGSFSAGFLWNEGSAGGSNMGVWNLSRNIISHNNEQHGFFTWQNDSSIHVVSDFAAYHNGEDGIGHGGYLNNYHYENGASYGNRKSAVDLEAGSWGAQPVSGVNAAELRFEKVLLDGANLSDALVVSHDHRAPVVEVPTVFRNVTFKGFKRSIFHFWPGERPEPIAVHVEQPNSALKPPHDVVMDPGTPTGNVVRIQANTSNVYEVTPEGRRATVAFEPTGRSNSPPQLAFEGVMGGSQVSGTVGLGVYAYDLVGTAAVELLVDGVVQGRDTEAPFTFTWDAARAGAGMHTLQARGYDVDGNRGVSALNTVFVTDGVVP